MEEIRLANKKDIADVARLHKEFMGGFLNSLGIHFLKLFYQFIITSKSSFCVVAEVDKKIIGFVSGTTSINKFYKEFLKKNLFRVGIILFPKLLNPKFSRKIFEALFYSRKKDLDLPNGELLNIVVEKGYRNKGIGKKLFNELEKEFKNRNIYKFKVITNILACKFYEKVGCILHSEKEVYKGENFFVYIRNINENT